MTAVSQAAYIVEAGPNFAQLWTDTRLPFEPKAEMCDARDELQRALAIMRPVAGMVLTGTYASLERSFCDVENVLFYNVGTKHFGHLVQTGLQFQRSYAQPCGTACGKEFRHHHHYRLIEPPLLPVGKAACCFEFPWKAPADQKPHEVWWSASHAAVSADVGRVSANFEMRVELHVPRPMRNLAAIVKPLLDGIISAFHNDAEPNPEAVRRLALRTGWDGQAIEARLRSPTHSILGPRSRLLGLSPKFVTWNPADERCERCTILQFPAAESTCIVQVWNL